MLQKPLETPYNEIMEIIRSVTGEKQKQLKSLYNKTTWILCIEMGVLKSGKRSVWGGEPKLSKWGSGGLDFRHHYFFILSIDDFYYLHILCLVLFLINLVMLSSLFPSLESNI